jgi:hypothetical protein
MRHILTILFVLAAAPAAYAGQTVSLDLAVYNQGRALITEVRSMDLGAGRSRVEFMGVPETVEPESLQVTSLTAPDRLKVLDMNYEYDLVSVKNLLDRYVGKTLSVVLPDPKDADAKIVREAELIANNDRPVFDLGDEIYVGPYESVLLPEIPEGLRPHPTLVWLVDNRGPAEHDVQVSYLAGKISWRADYVLKLGRDEASASLSGWITLENKSGMAFEGAGLKLVAGEVHSARPRAVARGDVMLAAEAASPVKQEEFFEYHLYDVGRPVNVGNRQTKQIRLLSAPEIGVRRELISEYRGRKNGGRPSFEQPVTAYLVFENTEENGLGMPLPKGIVRAYQESSDGSSLLIGEDNIDHTPEESEVMLTMGRAFDVKVERTLTDDRRIGKNVRRMAWRIEARNSKDEPVDLTLREYLPGDWDIVSASHEYEKESANLVRFDLTVPPIKKKGPVEVKYEAVIEY